MTSSRPESGPDELPAEDLATVLRRCVAVLTSAGVPSPRADVDLLAAHLLQLTPGQLAAAALSGRTAPARLAALVARRAAGEPVQHITGTAAFAGIEVQVGPGVFIPRPETELLVETVLRQAGRQALVVDLCTGSGAIAAALTAARPDLTVHAVELDPVAHAWAARNLPTLGERLVLGDATDLGPGRALPALDGVVDVVVSNPPYVPDGDPLGDAAALDPGLALWGGPDGTTVPLAVAARAALLLRSGGLLVLEHDVRHQDRLLAGLAEQGWVDGAGHRDLTGRPRYLTARRPGVRLAP